MEKAEGGLRSKTGLSVAGVWFCQTTKVVSHRSGSILNIIGKLNNLLST